MTILGMLLFASPKSNQKGILLLLFFRKKVAKTSSLKKLAYIFVLW